MIFNYSRVSQRIVIPLITTLFLAALGERPARAQQQSSQTPDIQEMQKKLQQLEKELLELKQQLNAGSGISQQAVPGPSVPDTTDTRQGEEHSEEPKPSSSINFYGYAMTDTGYNFGSINPNWFDVERPTQLPAFQGEFGPNGSTFAGVRQTRFGVKTFTPTPLGDLKTIFEFELFGTGVDAGQTTFRLRQAWGEMGHFGAGQTWSPFMDIGVFPNSIEYWGPNGMVFFRNVQFRWTPIKTDRNTFMIAAERPGASGDQGVYSGRIELSNITPQFILPDLSMQGHFDRKWGYFQIASMFRRIAWVDNLATPKLNLSGSAFGWGINGSSNLKFGE